MGGKTINIRKIKRTVYSLETGETEASMTETGKGRQKSCVMGYLHTKFLVRMLPVEGL